MIRRRLWISLVGIVTVAIALLAVNLLADNEPVLGLDLQGGISVVLSAEEGATAEDLDGIQDLIRDELEGRGIAEPDVRVEGENVIVDLPGVRDQREALEAVDVAGIVQLRPSMQPCTPPVEEFRGHDRDRRTSAPSRGLVRTGDRSTRPPTDATGTTTPAPAGFRRPTGDAAEHDSTGDERADRVLRAEARPTDDRATARAARAGARPTRRRRTGRRPRPPTRRSPS